MEVEPGAEAQVDFGQGAWVVVDGKRKRPHLFLDRPAAAWLDHDVGAEETFGASTC
jgi:hypothetical protein